MTAPDTTSSSNSAGAPASTLGDVRSVFYALLQLKRHQTRSPKFAFKLAIIDQRLKPAFDALKAGERAVNARHLQMVTPDQPKRDPNTGQFVFLDQPTGNDARALAEAAYSADLDALYAQPATMTLPAFKLKPADFEEAGVPLSGEQVEQLGALCALDESAVETADGDARVGPGAGANVGTMAPRLTR